MAGSSQQKLKMLYLIRILHEQSDEDHPMSAVDLLRELDCCGISAERKSIYKDLELLTDYGMDIIYTRLPKQGWFLGKREFELPELRLLIDAVQSAAFITPKKTMALLSKLDRQMSNHQARDMERQVYIESRVKCVNEEIYYNIDFIHRAIAQNKKVSFYYYRQVIGKGRTVRNEGKPFEVSPYAMLWVNDHYYLVSNLDKLDSLTHFRLDRMGKVKMLEDSRRSFEEVSEYRNAFDAADYARKCFSMFGGETELVELRCINELLEEIIDRFGENVKIYKDDVTNFRVMVQAKVSVGLVSWVLQFGTGIEVIAPKQLRQMIIERINGMVAMYKEGFNNPGG